MKREIDPNLLKELISVYENLPMITEDELKKLMPMLASPDSEIRELAAQTLGTTNIFKIPDIIELLYTIYPISILAEYLNILKYEPEINNENLEKIIINENTWIR